jgi:hypothetical protein
MKLTGTDDAGLFFCNRAHANFLNFPLEILWLLEILLGMAGKG